MSAEHEYPMHTNHPAGWPAIRRRLIRGAGSIMLLFIGGIVAWTWITLHFSYSTGQRVGYIQKISKKGWVCKTWEGELAMLNQPGVPAQIFKFTVRDEKVAQDLLRYAGQRVSLSYTQHRGVPTTCFGDTEYFIINAAPLGP